MIMTKSLNLLKISVCVGLYRLQAIIIFVLFQLQNYAFAFFYIAFYDIKVTYTLNVSLLEIVYRIHLVKIVLS